jgi:hypothetical protein
MSNTINLGGREFQIAPLKFRDLKRILPLFLDLGLDTEARIDAQGEIITAAVATSDPGFTRVAFDALSPTIQELRQAVFRIAILSGLEPRETPPGEASAASPSTGAASMA